MQTQTSQMSPIYEDNEVEFEPFKEVEDKRKTQNEENFEEEVIRAVSTASGQESTTNPVEVTESGQKASNRTRQIVMPKRFEDYYTGFMKQAALLSPFFFFFFFFVTLSLESFTCSHKEEEFDTRCSLKSNTCTTLNSSGDDDAESEVWDFGDAMVVIQITTTGVQYNTDSSVSIDLTMIVAITK
ncbi:hypothetical protein ACJJTC_007659 [Scirpophaga incertulas]